MFHPLERRESAVDACASAIRRAIMGGELEPGMRLPPERKLASTFGVNRVTVRGALARLASARLLRVRQGSGYVVRDFRSEGGPDLIAELVELASTGTTTKERRVLTEIARDLLLVRRHLARAVLERLSAQQSVDATGVARAIDRFWDAVKEGAGPDDLAPLDVAIVAALVDASGSPVLRLCMNPLQQVLSHMEPLRRAIYAEPEGNLVGWRALLAWLGDRDPCLIDDFIEQLRQRDEANVASLSREGRS